jgi:hypothetical protein
MALAINLGSRRTPVRRLSTNSRSWSFSLSLSEPLELRIRR